MRVRSFADRPRQATCATVGLGEDAFAEGIFEVALVDVVFFEETGGGPWRDQVSVWPFELTSTMSWMWGFRQANSVSVPVMVTSRQTARWQARRSGSRGAYATPLAPGDGQVLVPSA
jgi:hypothetical protein